MYKYFTSICLFFIFVNGYTQQQKIDTIPNKKQDSLVYKTNYGLRVGIDISKPLRMQFNSNYSGLELVGDYRLSKNFYAAVELGFEEETTREDFTNSTAKGNYARLGFNYNAYQNWLDMNNEIFLGFRLGLSTFSQTLNNYTPNTNSGSETDPLYFPPNLITTPTTANGLNAQWSEFVVGIKVETLKNLFISFSGSYKILINIKDPDNFKSLFSPGFNRVFASNTGFGFNYTLSYLIPFKKK